MVFNVTLRSFLACVVASTQLASLTFAQAYHQSDVAVPPLTANQVEVQPFNQLQDDLSKDEEPPMDVALNRDIIAAGEAVLNQFLKDYNEGEWIDAYLDIHTHDDGIVMDPQQVALALLSDPVDKHSETRERSQSTQQNEIVPPNQTASLQSLEAERDQSLRQFAVSLLVLNYGVLSTRQIQERSFEITNNGSTPLTGKVTTNSPFHSIISSDSFMLAPAASQTVTLRFIPPRPGLYLANAVVNSNRGTISVLLKGMVN